MFENRRGNINKRYFHSISYTNEKEKMIIKFVLIH